MCLEAMHNPVTLPCGHNGCKTHLEQSLGINPRCPVCRQEVPPEFTRDMHVNIDLKALIGKAYPGLDIQRQRLQEEEERQFQTNATIQEAVNLWFADRPACKCAIVLYWNITSYQ